jgi:N-acetylmuramoyl-L-alanine amidase
VAVVAALLAGTPALAGPKPSVVLDPGHGGRYPGAVNCDLRFAGQPCMRESDLNLDVALRAARVLRKRDVRVVLTRNTDRDVNDSETDIATHNKKRNGDYEFVKDGVFDLKDELQARVNIANCGTLVACPPGNERQADAFLSIHNDSCACDARGTTTFHYGDGRLATLVHREVLDRVGLKNRGVVREDLYVIRWPRMPAALLEGAFMSNGCEAKLLHRAKFRQKLAKGIAAGVTAFLEP